MNLNVSAKDLSHGHIRHCGGVSRTIPSVQQQQQPARESCH
jgi:metal-dependent hydrolase (beta-lactamase superfamily II)